MKIRDLSPRAPVTAAPSETLRSAARRMAEDDIGCLIIYGPTGPQGIFSERDLARAAADGVDIDSVQVKAYMTSAPVVIDQDEIITAGISKMNDYGVRHLMVTDLEDVIGVISMRDIVRHLDAVPALP